MLPVTTVPRPRTDLGGWLLPATRRWHAAEDPDAAVRAVLDDLATVLPVSASASVTLLGTGRRPGAPAGTRPATDLDAVQVRRTEGPLAAALAGTPSGSADLLRDARWPALAVVAGGLGVRAATCLPLETGRGVLGALSVYATGSGPCADRTLLTAAAGHAALAIDAVRRTAHLAVALESRDVIGQAKGVLMERHRVTADTAFGILVRASQDTHRKVREVAELVTETGVAPGPVVP
ncbi:GAF and ANTAR domain-containing protein [Geodermatophilus nigrescens]|uniref:GAF domain-containing protein n=1 Tax=Geodermatophilus nigrescens TaxID=1070870 RepID=A0A1M5IN28_9ACTN|nr:GAF and ANTAR domain-containing protein [Geodermatophilus nigrescens]SHG29360.1 GAF domain-containing protein [Geodermatophilus nigrescens]